MKKIDRKSFLQKSLIGGAGLALVGTSCASAETDQEGTNTLAKQKTYRWKMVTTWPPGFNVLGESCQLLADWIEEMSGGRLKIKVYGGGELVPSLEAFNTVSQGVAEMGHGSAYYWAGKAPAAPFFASVPFGMNAQQMNAWLMNGGGQALWDEVYAPFNVKSYPGGNTGVQMGGWFNREINSLADLKGLKMRIPGIGGKVLTKAGGSAINVAGGEIYTSLERGVIDATEWIGPYHDYLMGFHKIAKYYYYPGWHEPGTSLETFVNKAKFEALPQDLQAIVETAIYRQNMWVLSEFEARNNVYLQKLIEEGVEVRAYPPEVLSELRRLTQETLTEMTASDPLAKKVYTAYEAFRKQAANWSNLTEKPFVNQLQEA